MRFKVAIVGSGPGGLSAAAHAAELGVSHVLLEGTAAHANTIQRYQKGKFVMAEPGYLPLRSPIEFREGKREELLGWWLDGLNRYKVNVRYNAEVAKIKGKQGEFTLTLANGETLEAEFIVLGIGVQGNPRRVEAPGANVPWIEYTLDDPDAFRNETIIVIGAGDAAIENALALAKQNRVVIVNRQEQFARAKEGNLRGILKAIDDGAVECLYSASVARVEETTVAGKSGKVVFKTPAGETAVDCNRVIARLGAVPPRKFVESCGVTFPSAEANALPELDAQYQSSVPGLYVIGALAGYPLIKQAMNQGYEVVEYLLGRPVKPADYELLQARLNVLPVKLDVEPCLKLLRERVPMFGQLNPLLLRELVLESDIKSVPAGAVVYREGDYSTSFFTIVDGEVNVTPEQSGAAAYSVRRGGFFGEGSLLSGRRRTHSVTATQPTILFETPGRTMFKLMSSIATIKEGINFISATRALKERFVPVVEEKELRDVARRAKLKSFARGATLYKEGDSGEELFLIRRGTVAIARARDGRDSVVRLVAAGQYVGESALLRIPARTETARAAVDVDAIVLDREGFLELVRKDPQLVKRVQGDLQQRAAVEAGLAADPRKAEVLDFMLEAGLGEATNALLIDESLCVGCNNCEIACASTHNGVSRLNRAAGPSFSRVHVPTVCRHCETPHCMKDCPANAISRSKDGAVFINQETCIGCERCKNNCPYGAIKMAVPEQKQSGLWGWLLFGVGTAPGEAAYGKSKEEKKKKAVKCDLCEGQSGGPACVRSCPTGAALRFGPTRFTEMLS
jgi:Fe-S-cluster-containing hydrogenase component 2/thioredoxin reductase/CRP-like cAMP-binding protein